MTTMRRACLVFLLLFLASPAGAGEATGAPKWKALLVAGDDSIPVFDNAVRALAQRLRARGVSSLRILTSSPRYARSAGWATAENVNAALASLRVGPGDGCLLYFTSHGTEIGLLFARDARNNEKFYPDDLARSLDAHCGQAPTVVVVSGCHTGTFLRGALERENRIILTAARRDRASFGCDFRLDFTYFDGCFLDEFERARTWADAFRRTVGCVEELEAGYAPESSEPQAYFGAGMTDAALPLLP